MTNHLLLFKQTNVFTGLLECCLGKLTKLQHSNGPLINLLTKRTYVSISLYLDNIPIADRDQMEHDKCVKILLCVDQPQQLTLNESKSTLSAKKISVFGYKTGYGLVQPDKSRLQLPIVQEKSHLNGYTNKF